MSAYWRMQLHPADPGESIRHCVESLAAGFIGLDFAEDVGNLRKAKPGDLPKGQQDYLDIANRMKVGDKVLVIAHHFPFALATVASGYNYIARVEPEFGIWFRHFRKVKDVRYFADYRTNAQTWEQLRMTDALSPLVDTSSKSYQLIKEWGRKD